MIVSTELIFKALKSVMIEKQLIGKLIEATNKKDYELFEKLSKTYDVACSITDKYARELINQVTPENLNDLHELLQDLVAEKYGCNRPEGLSLSHIIYSNYYDMKSNGQTVESDSFMAELATDIHSLGAPVYYHSPEGTYKDEMLDHLSINVSRCKALRSLLRGDKAKFDEYNPDLYYSYKEARDVHEDTLKMCFFTSCFLLDQINDQGEDYYQEGNFTKEELKDIIKALRDYNKIEIASYRIQSLKRGMDMNIDLDQFGDAAKSDIRDGLLIAQSVINERERGVVKAKH